MLLTAQRNSFLLYGVLCAAVLAFIPLYSDSLYDQSFEFEKVFAEGWSAPIVSICFPIIASVPLLADVLIDIAFLGTFQSFIVERVIILIGLILPGIVLLCLKLSHADPKQTAIVYSSLCCSQSILCTVSTLSVVCHSPSRVWSFYQVLVPFTFFSAGLGFSQFSILDSNGTSYLAAFWALTVIAIAHFLYLSYFYGMFLRNCKGDIKLDEYLPITYSIVAILAGAFTVILPYATGFISVLSYNNEVLLAVNCSQLLVIVLLVVVPSRVTKFARSESERVNTAKKSIVRYISHELRTPANIASVGLSILADALRSCDLETETREVLGQVHESIFSITETLNNLLAFESIDNPVTAGGSSELNLVNVKPIEFIRNTLRLFDRQAQQNGIFFSLPATGRSCVGPHGDLNECTIKVDTIKMGQALRNFVSNAIKFTPLGGRIAVKTSIFCRQCVDDASSNVKTTHSQVPWLRIDVKDSGHGMTAETLKEILNEGIQFDHNQLEPGQAAGFTLFVSKSIVNRHGGRIAIHSAGIDYGSTFSIELPLCGETIHLHDVVSVNTRSWADLDFKSVRMSVNASMLSIVDKPSPAHSKAFSVSVSAVAESALKEEETSEEIVKSTARDSKLADSVHSISHNELHHQESKALIAIVTTHSAPPEFKLSNKRVLLVDDSLVNLKMIVMLFKKLGANCQQAMTGADALNMVVERMASNEGFDMVIMDNFMPVMSGPKACIAMRQAGYTGLVFGLTGHVLPVDMKEYYDAGADFVFKKPMNLAELQTVLHTRGEPLDGEEKTTTTEVNSKVLNNTSAPLLFRSRYMPVLPMPDASDADATEPPLEYKDMEDSHV